MIGLSPLRREGSNILIWQKTMPIYGSSQPHNLWPCSQRTLCLKALQLGMCMLKVGDRINEIKSLKTQLILRKGQTRAGQCGDPRAQY